MIAYLNGKFVDKQPTTVIIDLQGVGYTVGISLATYEKIRDLAEAKLYIHHHFSDAGQFLYGFFDETERDTFQLLISVSGVGPSTALVVVSSMTVTLIKQAILSDDDRAFSKVKGIGPKTAKRIIIDLKDKVAKEDLAIGGLTEIPVSAVDNTARELALSALLKLGYKRIPAQKALNQILRQSSEPLATEVLIRQALAVLS